MKKTIEFTLATPEQESLLDTFLQTSGLTWSEPSTAEGEGDDVGTEIDAPTAEGSATEGAPVEKAA